MPHQYLRSAIAPPLSAGLFHASASSSQDQHRHLDDDNGIVLDNSLAFRIWFGILLLVLILAQLKILVGILLHRQKPSMRLSQPTALAIFLSSGIVTTASCYLLLPSSDVSCALRDPLLLVSLQLSGSTLMARAWRIEVLLCPALNSGADIKPGVVSNARMRSFAGKAKNFLIAVCDRLVAWRRLCNIRSIKHLCRCGKQVAATNPHAVHRTSSKGLRRTISIPSLLFLVFMLCLPQLTLQILNLSIDSMRGTRTVVFDDLTGLWTYECKSTLRTGFTWLGAILAIIPYAATIILSIPSSGLPPIFDELRLFTSSLSTSTIVISTTGPAYAMSRLSPDAATFLLSATILCAPLSLCWFVGRTKLDLVRSGGGSGAVNLRRDSKAEESRGTSQQSFADFEKAASLALDLGSMFKAMGQKDREIELYDDALVKLNPSNATAESNSKTEDKIGGFLKRDIENFEPKTLKLLLKVLVSKGRALLNYSYSVLDYHQRGSAVMMDAIAIFEQAPASRRLKDRGILFPCYSALYQQLKAQVVFSDGAQFQRNRNLEVEQRLSHLFLSDARILSLPYCRALALESEVMGRSGKYREALKVVGDMQTIYSPERHSELIVTEYATDKCAQAISLTSFWSLCMMDIDGALEKCEYVVNNLIPTMYQGSANTFSQLVLPLLAVYQHLGWPDGKAARCLEIFQKYVIGVFYEYEGKHGRSPCMKLFKPLPIYLRLCADKSCVSYEKMDEDISWVLNGFDNDDMMFDCLDNVYGNTCWSPKTAVAETCYLLAARLSKESEDIKKKLVLRGLEIVGRSAENMKGTHNRIPLVLQSNERVQTMLKELAREISIGTDGKATQTSGNDVLKNEIRTHCVRLSRYLTPEAEEDFSYR